MNHIKKGSARTPLGIADKFDTYEKALKITLLNKFPIETPNNKLQEVTLQDGSKELDYLPGTIMDYMSCHQDAGTSQGDTRHSMPLARRRGSFNFED